MTVTAALLIVAQPGEIAPISGISLSSLDRSAQQQLSLFDTAEPTLPWRNIIIHDSGTLAGDWQAINTLHEQHQLGGLGYHFVIGNGRGAIDGEVHAGFRWVHQRPGAFVALDENNQPVAKWLKSDVLTIYMIGDFDRQAPTEAQLRNLVALIRALQQRFQIPADRVHSVSGNGRGLLFPEAHFRQQLLPIVPAR